MTINDLPSYLASQPANTKDNPYFITLKIENEADFEVLKTTLKSAVKKYVYIDLSGSTITTIPKKAFSTGGLSYTLIGIIIPDGVTGIEEDAFRFCVNLASIIIPNSMTNIGANAFSSTSLENVTIPSSVTQIEKHTFFDCNSLENVTIPDSVTNIGNAAFYSCDNLANVTIPDSVTHIERNAFQSCNNLTAINVDTNNSAYTSEDGVLYNKDKTTLIAYLKGKPDVSFIIPNGVTSIEEDAFQFCGNLVSITIPNSVISIGVCAFLGCSSLESVIIPNSVTNIGKEAFKDCTNLASVNIPNSVIHIGDMAFSDCTSLTSVTIPNSVTRIGVCAFLRCASLKSVTIPDSVTCIGKYAFDDCTSLESVTIPDSVTNIGNAAFSGCSSLTSITIPKSVTNIGNEASFEGWGNEVFEGCDNLTIINVADDNNSYTSQDGVLYNKDKTILIQYLSRKTDSSFNIPNGVTSIGEAAFINCANLANIIIPDSVTSIGDNAFFGCSSLASITISNSVISITIIEIGAFFDCPKLAAINVADENNAYTSQDGVLYDKSKTTLIKYPEGKIDVSFDIPNSVTGIMDYNFNYCLSLATINVTDDNNAYTSQDGVLYNKDKTILIRYPPGKADISFKILNGVISIDGNAFFNCTSLASVTIPESITSIGDGAFYGCFSLVSVTIQGTGLAIIALPADSREFCVRNASKGTPGTYTRLSGGSEWTKH